MIELIIIILCSLAASALLLLFLFERSRPRYEVVEDPRLLLRFEVPGGGRQQVEQPFAPFSCGFSQDYDLDLHQFISSPAGGAGVTGSLRITPADGGLQIESSVKLMINGVEGNAGRVAEGQLLRFQGLRITYLGSDRRQEQRKIPAPPYAGFQLLISSLLLFLSVFLVGVLPTRQSAQTVSTDQPPVPESSEPSRELQVQTRVQQIKPGAELPRTKVDLLFIHAHPDDESIDFGTLLASAQKAGLITAVLLMTDGESGIFSQSYTGVRQDLPLIRIAEAEEAMQLLGVEYYLRSGLPNHPYNGVEEEISVDEVFYRWGGREKLVNSLIKIIQQLEPAVIISPDGPSAVREHFEHEATGILVSAALNELSLTSGYRPAAHLISVDPRQREHYEELLGVPRNSVLELQRSALLSHRTQADASIFGVEMIDEFGNEYYHINFWSLHESPVEYLLR